VAESGALKGMVCWVHLWGWHFSPTMSSQHVLQPIAELPVMMEAVNRAFEMSIGVALEQLFEESVDDVSR
jgi:PII-like signaling protein